MASDSDIEEMGDSQRKCEFCGRIDDDNDEKQENNVLEHCKSMLSSKLFT